MINIYKRVEKSFENPTGFVEITDVSKLERPFLLCLSAQDDHDKSVFGVIREGATAARVYTKEDSAALFKIDEMPVDFLGIRVKRETLERRNYEEIVDNFLYPFLTSNGKKTVEELQKQARRINLMTYCDGTLTYERMEKRLEDKLHNDGLSQEDIDSILSQISLVAIGTMIDISNLKATSIAFVDVNDDEICNENTYNYQRLLTDNNKKCFYGTLSPKGNVLYIYNGTGKHNLKEYFSDDNIVKPAICSVVSKLLDRSSRNEKSDKLVSISSKDITSRLSIYADDSKEAPTLLRELDSTVSYDSCGKYTEEEARLQEQIDRLCGKARKDKEELEQAQKSAQSSLEKLKRIIGCMEEYSSEDTFYQILTAAGLYQPSGGVDAMLNRPSDKSIREQYEKMTQEQETLEPNTPKHM